MRHLWLFICEEKDMRILFESLDDAVEQIKLNPGFAYTLEQLMVWRTKSKPAAPEIILNTETGTVDKKPVRVSPVPLNRSGDVE